MSEGCPVAVRGALMRAGLMAATKLQTAKASAVSLRVVASWKDRMA